MSIFLPETGRFILGRNLIQLDNNRYVSTAVRSNDQRGDESGEEVLLWTRNPLGWSYQILYSMPGTRVESMIYMASGQLVIGNGMGDIVVIRVNDSS